MPRLACGFCAQGSLISNMLSSSRPLGSGTPLESGRVLMRNVQRAAARQVCFTRRVPAR